MTPPALSTRFPDGDDVGSEGEEYEGYGGPAATEAPVESVVPSASSSEPRSSKECGGGGGGGGKTTASAWQVYCEGPLLKAVQSARLFPDSKTFVDMPMKQDPQHVLAAFESLGLADCGDRNKLAQFVAEHFGEAGSDIVPVTPEDFSPQPSFLEDIEDDRRREWARGIHGLWALLVRKNVADVALNPQRHSLLPRRHPVVVPGGRFRESYYWDTFWIIRGLVVSGMVDTARGAVLNLLDDVDRFGFVPNGGRLYYTERSQPPLLSDMVCEVYSARPDRLFLARALPSLEAEHSFWMDFERGRAVCVPVPVPVEARMTPDHPTSSTTNSGTAPVVVHQTSLEGAAVLLNRYWGALDPPAPVGLDGAVGGKGVGGPLPLRKPRPESYREDVEATLGRCACGGGVEDGEGAHIPIFSGERTGHTRSATTPAPDVGAGRGATWPSPEESVHGGGGSTVSSASDKSGVGVGADGLCHELAAAAESGWDFSSRWAGLSSRDMCSRSMPMPIPMSPGGCGEMIGEKAGGAVGGDTDGDEDKGRDKNNDKESGRRGVFRLCDSATTSVVPVDLNAFLHRAELNIARLHHALAGPASGTAVAATATAEATPIATPTAPTTPDPTSAKPAPAARATEPDVAGSPPPPPLLSLEKIQRRFLSRRRDSVSSWSSSSSGILEKLHRQGEDDDVDCAAARAPPTAKDCDRDGVSSSLPVRVPVEEEGRPLSRKAMLFLSAARARSKAMEQAMWDERSGMWKDLLLPTGEKSPSITPACFVPMWAGLPWPVLDGGGVGDVGGDGRENIATPASERLSRCVEVLRRSGLVQPGGIRTSLEESGQQWDGRNAWPPLQWMLIKGLRRCADALDFPSTRVSAFPTANDENLSAVPAVAETTLPATTVSEIALSKEAVTTAAVSRPTSREKTAVGGATLSASASARKLALELEEAFLNGALAGWEATGGMMEKYDANKTGKGGGGGEYDLQVGFGWTNGAALDLLAGRAA